jgi:hypothetical protein
MRTSSREDWTRTNKLDRKTRKQRDAENLYRQAVKAKARAGRILDKAQRSRRDQRDHKDAAALAAEGVEENPGPTEAQIAALARKKANRAKRRAEAAKAKQEFPELGANPPKEPELVGAVHSEHGQKSATFIVPLPVRSPITSTSTKEEKRDQRLVDKAIDAVVETARVSRAAAADVVHMGMASAASLSTAPAEAAVKAALQIREVVKEVAQEVVAPIPVSAPAVLKIGTPDLASGLANGAGSSSSTIQQTGPASTLPLPAKKPDTFELIKAAKKKWRLGWDQAPISKQRTADGAALDQIDVVIDDAVEDDEEGPNNPPPPPTSGPSNPNPWAAKPKLTKPKPAAGIKPEADKAKSRIVRDGMRPTRSQLTQAGLEVLGIEDLVLDPQNDLRNIAFLPSRRDDAGVTVQRVVVRGEKRGLGHFTLGWLASWLPLSVFRLLPAFDREHVVDFTHILVYLKVALTLAPFFSTLSGYYLALFILVACRYAIINAVYFSKPIKEALGIIFFGVAYVITLLFFLFSYGKMIFQDVTWLAFVFRGVEAPFWCDHIKWWGFFCFFTLLRRWRVQTYCESNTIISCPALLSAVVAECSYDSAVFDVRGSQVALRMASMLNVPAAYSQEVIAGTMRIARLVVEQPSVFQFREQVPALSSFGRLAGGCSPQVRGLVKFLRVIYNNLLSPSQLRSIMVPLGGFLSAASLLVLYTLCALLLAIVGIVRLYSMRSLNALVLYCPVLINRCSESCKRLWRRLRPRCLCRSTILPL